MLGFLRGLIFVNLYLVLALLEKDFVKSKMVLNSVATTVGLRSKEWYAMHAVVKVWYMTGFAFSINM